MGVLALYPLAGTWDFSELAHWASTAELQPITGTLLGLGLIAGPMGKCAQFPLHLWLDEAMEGPVPSTILRNSVVVATGAWVLIKLEPVLTLSPTVQAITIAIGAATAIGATLISIAQIDVKRSLSYTVSAYMGVIFIAVGTNHPTAALLLILSHALAQGLLIMSSGSIILKHHHPGFNTTGWVVEPPTHLRPLFSGRDSGFDRSASARWILGIAEINR